MYNSSQRLNNHHGSWYKFMVFCLSVILTTTAAAVGLAGVECEWPTHFGPFQNTKYIPHDLGYFITNRSQSPDGYGMSLIAACQDVAYWGTYRTLHKVNLTTGNTMLKACEVAGYYVETPQIHASFSIVTTLVQGPPLVLHAHDADSLAPLWNFTLPQNVIATHRTAGGPFIFLGATLNLSTTSSSKRKNQPEEAASSQTSAVIYIFNITQGELLAEIFLPNFIASLSSLVTDSTGSQLLWQGNKGSDGTLYAGSIRGYLPFWTVSLDTTQTPTELVYAESHDLLLVTLPSTGLIALNASTGATHFDYPCMTLNAPISPAVDESSAFIPCHGQYHRIDLSSGQSTQQYSQGEYSNDILAFRDVIVIQASNPVQLQVYIKDTGALANSIPLPGYFNKRVGFSGGWLWATAQEDFHFYLFE